MLKFKDFISPKEFCTFANAGGPEGQYDKFDFTGNMLHGQGGGSETKNEEFVDENLNPRIKPERIDSGLRFLHDPEADNKGLADDHNDPENIGIPDYHGVGYVNPRFTNKQAKNAKILSDETQRNDEFDSDYYDFIPKYTSNSYNLNDTIHKHGFFGKQHPEEILSNEDEDSLIHVPSFDRLIDSHRLPHGITVYSGLHFHPNDHRGKIAVVHPYMSASLSPHVAKDFGKKFDRSVEDGEPKIKNILRLHLPEGHPALNTDNASLFPGQGELILPRGMRFQFGQKPTHIVKGRFDSHFGPHRKPELTEYHFYNGRILPRK